MPACSSEGSASKNYVRLHSKVEGKHMSGDSGYANKCSGAHAPQNLLYFIYCFHLNACFSSSRIISIIAGMWGTWNSSFLDFREGKDIKDHLVKPFSLKFK